jgi:hypothetical protein
MGSMNRMIRGAAFAVGLLLFAGVSEAAPITFDVLLSGSAQISVEQTGEATRLALDSVLAVIDPDTPELLEFRISFADGDILVDGQTVSLTDGLLVMQAPSHLLFPFGPVFQLVGLQVDVTGSLGGNAFASSGTTDGLIALEDDGGLTFSFIDQTILHDPINGFDIKANIDFTAAIPEPGAYAVFALGTMVVSAAAYRRRRVGLTG